MKLKTIHSLPLFLAVLLLLAGGCSREPGGTREEEVYLYLTVAAASSINEDRTLWEDRVDELRMLVFETESGEAVFNQKLYFPDGFDSYSRAVPLTPGVYDFYFIANETVYAEVLVPALMEVENRSDFDTDDRFRSLAYLPYFVPDDDSTQGRFVMSAIYESVTVEKGGTEANPLPLSLPTARVELIRALAKVDVVFRKMIAGSTVPDHTVTSVQLINVAAATSVPPVDSYYTGLTAPSPQADIDGFDYSADSIGAVTFYVPELLVRSGGEGYTELHINNRAYPIQSDDAMEGLTLQRRSVDSLSPNSVIRNYHYIVNAYLNGEGGIQLEVHVTPWTKDSYIYVFQGDQQIVIPPIYPTDSSVIFPSDCGKIEVMSVNENLTQGLQGAYNDVVNYYDPEVGGPVIYKGDPPYYCEKKYGPGWRLINSCELLSFLALCDEAYNIWTSNTWEADQYDMPSYPRLFREYAQGILESLTGWDLSGSVLYDQNNFSDELTDMKLDLIDRYFTPGDIMVRVEDYPNGWPFASPPGTDLEWFYNEVTIQVKAYWYRSSYLSPTDRDNWNTILYHEFERYDFSNTVSRCVRVVD